MILDIRGGTWAASEIRWQDDGLCNGAPIDFTPDKETAAGLAEARRWCDLCPARVTCLRYALTYGLCGYWGGTDTAERRQLRAKKDRVKCPSPACRSRRVIGMEESKDALCLACGLSWQTAAASVPRRRPEEAKAA